MDSVEFLGNSDGLPSRTAPDRGRKGLDEGGLADSRRSPSKHRPRNGHMQQELQQLALGKSNSRIHANLLTYQLEVSDSQQAAEMQSGKKDKKARNHYK